MYLQYATEVLKAMAQHTQNGRHPILIERSRLWPGYCNIQRRCGDQYALVAKRYRLIAHRHYSIILNVHLQRLTSIVERKAQLACPRVLLHLVESLTRNTI